MKIKKIYLLLLGVLLVTGCSKNNDVILMEILLNCTAIELNKGEVKQLTINAIPEGYSGGNVSWSSSNISIATVDDMGLVTGIKEEKPSLLQC